MINYSQLKMILPQAYPFLLIDHVESYQPGESLVAIKNITANEWPFSQSPDRLEHYPETLLIEAAAQAALVLYRISKNCSIIKESKFVLGQIKAEFHQPIAVGQQLRINAIASKMLDDFGYMNMNLLADLSQDVAEIQIFYKVI